MYVDNVDNCSELNPLSSFPADFEPVISSIDKTVTDSLVSDGVEGNITGEHDGDWAMIPFFLDSVVCGEVLLQLENFKVSLQHTEEHIWVVLNIDHQVERLAWIVIKWTTHRADTAIRVLWVELVQ
ncbi:hypothetical protein WICPIJ_003574 [Wickerhamomyces pijperi]|uniref:Uncharacterized protein n=1 Tax=Wickerhamomyces pijperi TaxID=599730 RepID=A0A9P8TNR5_WICPI|nr:hypothetical protein WICPIJ_003574 [Wickerhamomyces pijperi]